MREVFGLTEKTRPCRGGFIFLQNIQIFTKRFCQCQESMEIAKLKNLSLLASMTGDVEWQHELCARLEKLSR
nr:hypothetical protein [Geobacillus sp. C56-T3]